METWWTTCIKTGTTIWIDIPKSPRRTWTSLGWTQLMKVLGGRVYFSGLEMVLSLGKLHRIGKWGAVGHVPFVMAKRLNLMWNGGGILPNINGGQWNCPAVFLRIPSPWKMLLCLMLNETLLWVHVGGWNGLRRTGRYRHWTHLVFN